MSIFAKHITTESAGANRQAWRIEYDINRFVDAIYYIFDYHERWSGWIDRLAQRLPKRIYNYDYWGDPICAVFCIHISQWAHDFQRNEQRTPIPWEQLSPKFRREMEALD